MPAIHTVHSAALRTDQIDSIKELVDEAFAGSFGDDDWEHTLGGLHALVYDDHGLVAHGAVVQRRLVCTGRALRTGYVEALAVRADRRRLGYAKLVLTEVEAIVERGYDLGALSDGSGIDGLYDRRGWIRWRGPTAVLGPDGFARTPEDDGAVLVWRTARSTDLDPGAAIACDWRPGDVW